MAIEHVVKTALVSTIFALATIFLLNRFGVTRSLVQTALTG
jgi:hypothetical protein